MKTRCTSLLLLCFATVLVVSLTWPAAAQRAQPEYTAKVVLRLEYGRAIDEVPLDWGPLSDRARRVLSSSEFTSNDHCTSSLSGFAVDAAGAIYVSAYQHGVREPGAWEVVKKFRPSVAGPMAASVEMYTAPDIGGIMEFLVSPEGSVFVLDGIESVVRYGSDGRRLWARPAREISTFSRESRWGALHGAPTSSVYLGSALRGPYIVCSLATTREAKKVAGIPPQYGVVLDGQGEFVAVLPTDRVSLDGRLYSGLPQYDEDGRVVGLKVWFYDEGGEIVEEVQCDVSLEGHSLFDASRYGVYRTFIDAAGHIVVQYSAAVVPDRFAYGSVLEAYIQDEFIRYDSEGRFLEKWSFPGSPFENLTDSTIIGQDGNFYHLAFDDTGVSVVQYLPSFAAARRSEEALGVTHLAAYRAHDTLYTRLRDTASGSGASVTWRASDSTAVVAKAGRRLVLRPGSDRAFADGEGVSLGAPVELRGGRLWVPTIRVAALLELPVYTDDSKRVAYRITHR